MASLFRTRAREEDGAVLVEFALVLPLLLVLILGMFDFGKAFNYWIDSTHLANEGARWAVVNRNPGGGTLQQYVQDQATTAELQTEARRPFPRATRRRSASPSPTARRTSATRFA